MFRLMIAALLATALTVSAQTRDQEDVWAPLRYLEGTWIGEGDGYSGRSSVTKNYEFILDGKFLRTHTRAVFEPQERNPEGEIHEDFAVFSYDRIRRTIVLRAFYIEGFVNTYVLRAPFQNDTLMFETEHVENAPAGTHARLLLERRSDGQMQEQFFVAFPGQKLGCMSTITLTRE